MNIFYLDNDGEYQSSTNSTIIKIEDMLQRIQTFQGEQSFNASNGIDYLSIFNKRALLKPQLESIIALFDKYFQEITYLITDTSNDTISISIRFTLFNGDIATRDFIV